MSLPAVWNPVKVKILPLDISGTPVDPVFKVPVNRKTRDPLLAVTYDAQINFGSKRKEYRDRTLMGDRPNTRARIVLRTADLAPNTAVVPPKKGDRIVGIYVGTAAEQTVDYLIEEVRPESPLGGVPLLLYCEFERDRERG